MENYYHRLRIGLGATSAEIKTAYKAAARTHHPDHAGNAEEWQRIQDAYKTLSDPDRRANYDRALRRHLRERNLFLCQGCGSANEIPSIPPGKKPVCGACKSPLEVSEQMRRAGQREVLKHAVATALEDVGGEVVNLARDAAKHGLVHLRKRWFSKE